MIKCMKKGCLYYKQQFEEGVEICPSCGQPVVKTETKVNSNLAITAALAGAASILIFGGVNIYAGYVISAASIVCAFISKSIPSIVITFAALAVTILLTLSFAL